MDDPSVISASTALITIKAALFTMHRGNTYAMTLLIALSMFGVCSATQSMLLTRTSALDTSFSHIQQDNDLQDSVTYDSIGKESYDRIFLQTAQITAAVGKLGSALGNIDTSLNVPAIKAALHLSKGTSFRDVVKALEQGGANTDKVLYPVKTVHSVLKKTPGLQDSIQTLLSEIATLNPIQNLTRYQSYKAPDAVNALKAATTTLNEDKKQLDTISERANRLARKITAALQ